MKKGLTKQQIVEWGIENGWELDRYGHLNKNSDDGRTYRIKLGKRSVRYEKQIELGLIDENYPLSEPTYEDWGSLSEEEKL